MAFFVDTNVPLGYTVIHDKWHDNSNNFINNNSDVFWSNLVRNEYEKKLNDILDEIDIFLKLTETILKNNNKDFSNFYSFENYILQRTKRCKLDDFKKQKILEYFWIKYNIFEGISEQLYHQFRNFKKMYFRRDKRLNKILKLHNCGLNNYLTHFDSAKKLFEWGVRKPDCKILVDAHDCGLKHDELIFISNDIEMLEKIMNHDTSFLEIIEFKSCT